MLSYRHFTFAITTVIIFSLRIHGNIFTLDQESDIERFVQSVLACRNIPGLMLSVVKGEETWSRGFGLADVFLETEVTNETLFVIGSVGKALTMTLLGIMIEEKGFTWETKLSNIPGLHVTFVDDNITREATLTDLLSHKTGLSPLADFGFIAGYPFGTTREYLVRRLQHLPKRQDFRSGFVYNNMMYTLLGYVIELLGNNSWEDLITNRLFEPLGMTTSTVLTSGVDLTRKGVSRPYIIPGGKIEDGNYEIYRVSPLEPAGAILSSGVDMAKWMRFNLENGTTAKGQQLISQSLFWQAFQAHNDMPYGGLLISQFQPVYPVNDTTSAYGYAWFTSHYRGRERFWHSGELFSFRSLLWLFPKQKVGLFVNINGIDVAETSMNALKTILSYIADRILGDDPWLDSVTACTYPNPWVNFSVPVLPTNKPENLTSYDDLGIFAGTYGTELLPDVTISVKYLNQQPFLWFKMNRITGRLLPTTELNMFKFQMEEPWEFVVEHKNADRYFHLYPVRFHVRKDDGRVDSFEFYYGFKEVATFRRNVRFMSAVPVSRGLFLKVECLVVMTVSFIYFFDM